MHAKFLLAVSTMLLLIVLFSVPITAYAKTPSNIYDYPNTYQNTKNDLSNLLGVVTTQLGYHRHSGTDTKYGIWYGTVRNFPSLFDDNWCAMFLSWCCNEANVPDDVIARFYRCSEGAAWFMQTGRWKAPAGYIPKTGDIIFFRNGGSSNINHVGIVTGSDGVNITTIEGNHSESVERVTHSLQSSLIAGYGTPAYRNTSVSTTSDSFSAYRLYNYSTGEHFFTEQEAERDSLVRSGWKYEGVAWKTVKSSVGTPVYRLYNYVTKDHHYTTSKSEKNLLANAGWLYEGIAFYVAKSGKEVYRLYNPQAYTGIHHFTASKAERDLLISSGWVYEGVVWYTN